MSQLSDIFLLWVGSAAMGLTWGWLIGLWTDPPRRSRGSARSPRSLSFRRLRLARAWLARRIPALIPRLRKIPWSALRRVLRPSLLIVLAFSPLVEVWAYGGTGPAFLAGTATGAGWWLHRAWREQLRSGRGRRAPNIANDVPIEH